jgi:hypothetical protein
MLHIYRISLMQPGGRVSTQGRGVKQVLPGYTGEAIANDTVAVFTMGVWIGTSTSAAMLDSRF